MRIDLHTHSEVSDGTASPGDLVRDAVAAGLDVLALTDHDTTAGWAGAESAARGSGLTLVRGLELSTTLRGESVHLLAYLPDPTHRPLVDLLARTVEGRLDRVPAMLERLREAGIEIGLDDLHRAGAQTSATGRPHVADALVRAGVVADRDQAFRDWLAPGRPGYVERWAVAVEEAVRVVDAAGGASVLAHPWGRYGRDVLDEPTIAGLAEQGLAGIEVDHQDHDVPDRRRLRALAAELDLVATGSSDHHGTGKVDHGLGCHTTDPGEYARLLARADLAAERSGLTTPDLVS